MIIGFIGLGNMGLPMAKNVIKNGYSLVTTYHNRKEPAEELANLGAEVVGTAKEIAQKADVVITVLPADKALQEVVLGKSGLVEGLSANKVLIDMTTAQPQTLQEIEHELAKIDVEVVDAPVSGGTKGAEAGTLTIMVGAKKEVFEEFKPLLKTMGQTLFYTGGVGQGKVVKLVNQLFAAIHLMTIGEVFALGIKSGADPKLMYDVLKKSAGYSKMMDLKLENYLFKDNFEPGFKLDLMKKDITLAVGSAKELGVPLLFGSTLLQIFTAVSQAGHGNEDHSAVAKYIANLSNVDLSL